MAEDPTNAGTTTSEPQAQPDPAGTAPTTDEVTTLRSRNAGLDAKVSALTAQIAAANAAREAAQARLTEYEEGKAGESEAARAQLERLNAALEAANRLAKVNELKATYPETWNVYGDAIAGMSPDILAAGEARLKGVAVESEPPVPVANNAQRAPAVTVKPIAEMTAAELKAYGNSAFAGLTWESLAADHQGD